MKRALALSAAALILVAACGGDDDDNAGSTSTTEDTEQATTTTTTEATGGGDMFEIGRPTADVLADIEAQPIDADPLYAAITYECDYGEHNGQKLSVVEGKGYGYDPGDWQAAGPDMAALLATCKASYATP